MIDAIKAGIASAYKSVYPTYDVRIDDVPNNFKKPAFAIMVYDFEYWKSLGDRYTGKLYFDDLYFPGNNTGSKRTECLYVQQEITKAFTKLVNFRAKDQSCEVIDNVLHHKYTITYRELRREDIEMINTMLSSVGEKEE